MTSFSDYSNTCIAAMPHEDEPPDWFIDLWLAASDGDASEEDLARFNSLIEQSATARGQLFELAHLHAWLEWMRTRMESPGE